MLFRSDDIADEGNLTKNERKKLLREIEININSIKHRKKILTPFFRDLDRVINQYSLDIKLFERFMSAFKQDVEKKTYRNFNDLINYCNKAACPAGEMILSLFDSHNKKNVSYSNSLCQALALIGMTQDIHEDLLKGRVYIPLTEMKKFTLKESDIKTKSFNHNWKMFKNSWLKRIELLLNEGRPLGGRVTGRLKLQIKILIAGAELLVESKAAPFSKKIRRKKQSCQRYYFFYI